MADEILGCERSESAAALIAVSAVLESLGRALICLDREFRVVHTSARLGEMIGADAVRSYLGHPVAQLLGSELFAADGALRDAMERGERREGWRASMALPDGTTRLVSCSAAPFRHDDRGICDPNVAYIIIVRPAEDDPSTGTASPTGFAGMIARSSAMTRLFHLIDNLQTSDATILLTGESGTGKEVLAHAIHANSPRKEARFVAVNCGALPADLLEAELFGHVRGAFTGAIRDRIGRVELASGGTLFLDEIGDLPLQLQVKFLRFLQEKTFERVGDSHTRKADVRIIAATNVDLRRAINEGRFREDLFYRLRVVPIEIPPLRARREDIEPLARHLLVRVAGQHGRELRFSPDTIRAMLRYSWPGNVRELENAIEYAVAVGRGQTIQPEDLPQEILESPPASRKTSSEGATSTASQAGETRSLRAALEEHHWNREATAHALGIGRTTLWRKMRECGLADGV
ncbi:MAG TPA: sigma 54-interacting transcriptional regulator [Thermoanaerobaculia bacterium]|nr:sigma 54-interacting transcriptional regulator [Thermoanaerobaculia bacterium]